MRLTALGCGTILCDLGLLFEGAVSGESDHIPITCFLVHHRDGVLLWDTGMNPAVRVNAIDHWGGIAKRALVPQLGAGEDVVERLDAVGVSPDGVDVVVNSHLHNDHCGMNGFFPSSRILLREREFAHAKELMDTPSSGFIRDDFFHETQGTEVFDYDDSFDIFGDGAVTLLSTEGHTPGHQSLQVTFPSGSSFVLTGDAVYSHDQLCACRASGITWDAAAMLRSIARLQRLQAAGVNIVVAHDRSEWAGLGSSQVLHEED